MSNTPGITIKVPEKAPSSGPIPLQVTMVADMQAYTANNGILDTALDLALIRRDGPGLKFISKLDPNVWMEPETPLPPAPPGTDPDNAGFINETREFDVLDYGAEHDGAAEYYVLASFAGWISQVAPLAVEDKSHSLPPGDALPAPPLTFEEKVRIIDPPDTPGMAVQISDGETHIEGGLRVIKKTPKFPGEQAADPFVTIIIVRLAPAGGMWGGSFSVDFDIKGKDSIAQFSIPFAAVSLHLEPGKYCVFVFSGDESADPLDFQVPDHD